MIATIQPEMAKQVQRWGGTMNQWNANVLALKTFIDDRCDAFSQGMIDCYTLTGPYQLKYNVDPPGSGTIQINSVTPGSYPFTGTYYGGIDILQKAQANTGWVFKYWETQNHPVSPDTITANSKITITGTDSIIAHFVQINPPDPDPDPEPDPDPIPDPDPTPDPVIPADTSTSVEMSNIFTPNGDNNNDYFRPKVYKYVYEPSLIIFNRWGQKVFETTDLVTGWDGKTNGKAGKPGVYFWMLKYTDNKGELNQVNGHVTLIR
jgi:gliding motility-associated-like protein